MSQIIASSCEDAWQKALEFLCEKDLYSIRLVSKIFRNICMRRMQKFCVFTLSENRKKTKAMVAQDKKIPVHVTKLCCINFEFCKNWSNRIGFFPASRLVEEHTSEMRDGKVHYDTAGWCYKRPMHQIELDTLARLQSQAHNVLKFKILDRRSNWIFWDSLSLHPELIQYLFTQCKTLEEFRIDHLCLTYRYSFQAHWDRTLTNEEQIAPKYSIKDENITIASKPRVKEWILPNLKRVLLLDTIMDVGLLNCFAMFAPNLEILHVHEFSSSIDRYQFSKLLSGKFLKLQTIQVGYSFHKGKREYREVDCSFCKAKMKASTR